MTSRQTGRRTPRQHWFPAAEQKPGSTRTLLPAGSSGGTVAGAVRRTVLPGGLRILTEQMPASRSAAVGIWVGVGSRDESRSLAGATHFLEHLLFKGTRRRDALAISAAIDAVGGEMNAFTAKEYTCYYARVLDRDLPLAIDVVADMVTSSLIAKADVDGERNVILEEIAMHADDPTDAVHDEFATALLGDAPLGRPILGTVSSITGMSRGAVAGHYKRRYTAPNLVVTAAGNLAHTEVVKLTRAAFRAAGALSNDGAVPAPARIGGKPPSVPGGVRLVSRPTEQANVVLGVPGLARTDERRYALDVLNTALGGGMSSRLFQEIREKRGMAYSVYSYAAHYADVGMFGVYAGCLPKKVEQVLDVCRAEMTDVAAHGITAEELDRARGQLKGSFVLGMEDTGSRMGRLGKSELVYGDLLSVDDVLDRIDAVTLDDVAAVAADLLGRPETLAVIGPFDDASAFAA